MMQQGEQVKEQMYAHIEQWKQSGLSQKGYCKQNALKYHVFHYWYKLYRDQHLPTQKKEAKLSPASFIPLTLVNPSPAGAFVELHLSGGHYLVFHQPVSADYLKALIS